MPTPHFEMSEETVKIKALFVACLAGDRQVLWTAIEEAAGKPRDEVRSAVNTVRRHGPGVPRLF